ncbi:MAG: class I fructose-bisphosphate aldolase, partial [Granulosicoccus sp.]
MTNTISLLGDEAEYLLDHTCKGLPKELVNLPGPDFVNRVMGVSDRGPGTMRAMQQLFSAGRLGGTGYMS